MKLLKLFSFIVLANFICATSFAQINHVEPLNWFVGMKNPNLQLLINGNNIGETTPQINYPGVTIKNVNKADSKNYLFIDLLIAKTAKPGIMGIVLKKMEKNCTVTNMNLKKENRMRHSSKVSILQMLSIYWCPTDLPMEIPAMMWWQE
jgi:hypothetical protein